LYTAVAALLLTISSFAQAPEEMSYQAVRRNAGNALVANQQVGMQISILQGSTAVYEETQTPTSNSNGLVSLEIGTGTVISGSFTAIDWSAGTYFIKTETDLAGGTNYTITGVSQLLSVPFALYAKTSGNASAIAANTAKTGITSGQADAITANTAKTGITSEQSDAITATQTALDLKENSSNKSTATALGTSDDLFPTQKAVKTYVDASVAAGAADASTTTKGIIQLAGDLAGTAALPTVPGLALKAPIEDPTFTGTVSGIDKSMVGLADVDNTTDADKPVSTATSTALDLKANLASPTFTGTVVGITSTMVGLGSVDNTTDALKPVSTATQTALNLKETTANKSTGTALGTSDVLYPTQNAVKTYVDVAVTGAAIADAATTTKGKIQLAGDLSGTAASPTVPGLALKAPIASPTFTGTVSGIDKTMVGLANVDNTTDALKPVSTATQNALNLKLDANKVGAVNGAASLDAVGKIPSSQLSPIALSSADVRAVRAF